MAGLAVLRRAFGLSALQTAMAKEVFEQAVLGTPACSVRCRTLVLAAGGNQRAVMLLYSAIPLGTIMSGIKSRGGR